MRVDRVIKKLIIWPILPPFERFHCFQRINFKFIFYLNTRIHLSRLKTETFKCCCFKLTTNLWEMYTPGRWCGLLVNCLISIVYRTCIAAYWILYSELGLVSCIDLFFDVSDGQLRCKINTTSSKFTAFNLNTVKRSEDLSNKSGACSCPHTIFLLSLPHCHII